MLVKKEDQMVNEKQMPPGDAPEPNPAYGIDPGSVPVDPDMAPDDDADAGDRRGGEDRQ
jgi:hypothetical protein